MTDPAPRTGEVPLWNIANVLTMVRIVMVPLFAWLFLQDTTPMRVWAAVVFALAALTDKLDGSLARSRGLVTDFGKLADPFADKALVITALVVLSGAGLLWWGWTVIIVVRELGITVLRFVMVRRAVMAASKGGKLKTVLQIIFILLLTVPWDGFLPSGLADAIAILAQVVVVAAVAVTLVTGIDYVVKAVRISRATPPAGSRTAR